MTLGPTEQIITTEDSSLVVIGYRLDEFRRRIVEIFCFVLLGIPSLLFRWFPTWRLKLTHSLTPLQSATSILIIETYQKKLKTYYIEPIQTKNLSISCGLINKAYEKLHDDKDVNNVSESNIVEVNLEDGTKKNLSRYQYFTHKKHIFIWDESRFVFLRLCGIENSATCSSLHTDVLDSCRQDRLCVFGSNETAVPRDSVIQLIINECLNPFYVFQLFTIIVWIFEEYYYYCIAIALMSIFGVALTVTQTRKNQANLKAAVEMSDTVDIVERNGEIVTCDSRQIAPGDIIALPTKPCRLHFDAVLITGSCLVDEGMLTGESVPITKTMLPRTNQKYDPKEHSGHTLYCGTNLIQTRYYPGERVKCLVIRTGYLTSKGQLVRSILYPAPADFKFDRDSYKFIIILAVLAFIGLLYTVILKARRDLTAGDIILKALDIITIVIPPALPAAMTVGRLYAVNRLAKRGVYCLNTRAINVSGSIDCFCFDKTGTLTEEGLDMRGVVCSTDNRSPNVHMTNLEPQTLPNGHYMKMAMASCHSLTLLDGKLAGDPLDLKMFESTEWILEEPLIPETNNYQHLAPTVVRPNDQMDGIQLGILMQHQFVSHLQRASVVVKLLGTHGLRVFCKGAPEAILALSRKETVPPNLLQTLSAYAEKGYRVIAAATKRLNIDTITQLDKVTRDEIESDLEFLGLIILENRLKPVTTEIINRLKKANLHIAMITGDNIHTAVSVAKECGILESQQRLVTLHVQPSDNSVPVIGISNSIAGVQIGKMTILNSSPYSEKMIIEDMSAVDKGKCVEDGLNEPDYKVAMSGDVWKALRTYYPGEIPRLIVRGAVFARMSSDQKQQLVQEYQALGFHVGMCGDGANDCGALRTADAGLSVSTQESSVAAAFSTTSPDISAVPDLLREGRAALSTSFGVFKFMIAYSLTEFISVAFLYYFESNLTDFQFLFIDLFLAVNFAFFFGETQAADELSKKPPLNSLLSFGPLVSLIFHTFVVAFVQFLSYYAMIQFDWFVPHSGEDYACFENYAIFGVSCFQYIFLTFVFSHGAPYRKTVLTNYKLIISALVMTCVCLYMIFYPADFVVDLMELVMPLSMLMPCIIVILVSINFLVSLAFERVVVEYMIQNKEILPRCLKERRVKKTPYKVIQRFLTKSDYVGCDFDVTLNDESLRKKV